MIWEKDIKNWQEHKIVNYLPNYTRRNKLTISQEKEMFFSKTHENFVDFVPQSLKKLLDERADMR